jgi:hypothetical protein
MKFVPLTNSDRYAIVDDEDYEAVIQHKWALAAASGSGECVQGTRRGLNRQREGGTQCWSIFSYCCASV